MSEVALQDVDRAEEGRGGLVFKAHRLCVSLNSRDESNKEEEGLRLIDFCMEVGC